MPARRGFGAAGSLRRPDPKAVDSISDMPRRQACQPIHREALPGYLAGISAKFCNLLIVMKVYSVSALAGGTAWISWKGPGSAAGQNANLFAQICQLMP